MRIAFGLRAHSGWAALVAVAGSADKPRVLDRRRIVVADPQRPGSKQPYHAAAGLPFAQARALIDGAVESSRALAREAISAAAQSLQGKGHEVEACGILRASGRPLPELQAVLAAHPLIHTAEGEMFRDALAWAARECGMAVVAVREKELDADSLARLNSLGRLIGPPWTQDQKFATLAGLMALKASR